MLSGHELGGCLLGVRNWAVYYAILIRNAYIIKCFTEGTLNSWPWADSSYSLSFGEAILTSWWWERWTVLVMLPSLLWHLQSKLKLSIWFALLSLILHYELLGSLVLTILCMAWKKGRERGGSKGGKRRERTPHRDRWRLLLYHLAYEHELV